MVKPAELRDRDDTAFRRRLDDAMRGGVARERHVRTVRVVVASVLAEHPTQMVFAEHDHVVDELSTCGPDPPFREAVLPWGARRRPELLQVEVLDAAIERGAEDRIAVADQARDRSVGANGFHDLLRPHSAVGCSVTLTWITRRRSSERTKNT